MLKQIMAIHQQSSILTPDGTMRLRLLMVEVGKKPCGFNFHALVWEYFNGNEWKEKISITEKKLSKVLGENAWVADIHSFNAENGTAILRFGTEGPTDCDGMHWQLYSWREWDLLNNREHRFIEICDSPFDKLRDNLGEKMNREWKNSINKK